MSPFLLFSTSLKREHFIGLVSISFFMLIVWSGQMACRINSSPYSTFVRSLSVNRVTTDQTLPAHMRWWKELMCSTDHVAHTVLTLRLSTICAAYRSAECSVLLSTRQVKFYHACFKLEFFWRFWGQKKGTQVIIVFQGHKKTHWLP